jgi:very-short-patch-repair endonuclease
MRGVRLRGEKPFHSLRGGSRRKVIQARVWEPKPVVALWGGGATEGVAVSSRAAERTRGVASSGADEGRPVSTTLLAQPPTIRRRWIPMPEASAAHPAHQLPSAARSGIVGDRIRSSTMPGSPEARLAELAGRQRGVFTRVNALTLGVSKGMLARRIETGLWLRVLPGVYRMASTQASWPQTLLAGCLWANAVVSHFSAASLYGLEGVPRCKRGDPIELTGLRGTICRAPGFVVHRTRQLERNDQSVFDGIPVTSLARTLVDLSPLLDERHLGAALDSGLATHRFIDVGFLAREIRRLRTSGRSISPTLARLLEARAPDALHLDSVLERRFSGALRRARLPRPKEHFEVIDGGRRLAEVDFAYPRARLAIQLHGASIHRRCSVWERDQDQSSELAAAGWRVINVTWAQLEASEADVLERVRRALLAADGGLNECATSISG